MKPEVSIVIPTRNEEENIAYLIQHIKQVMRGCRCEAVVVDDSTDDTAKIAWNAGARIVKGQGRGLGQAIVDGIESAEGKAVVVMDADYSHDPNAIPRLIKPILEGTHELVIGSRYVEGGMVEDWSLYRRFSSWAARMMARKLTDVRDSTSGFFALHKPSVENLRLEPRSWKVMLEVLVKSSPRVLEVPIRFTDRRAGKSKYVPWKEGWAYVKHLIHLHRYRPPHDAPDYEWRAYWNGNRIQKWWKQQIIKKTLELEIIKGKSIDIGCGSSSCAHGSMNLDTNKAKLSFLKRRQPWKKVGIGSIDDIPHKDSSLDCVLCIEVIEHLPDPQKAMEEMNRVLKPGGQLVLATPDFGSRIWRLIEWTYGLTMRNGYHEDHISPFTKESILELGRTNGFRCERIEQVARCDMVLDFRKEIR